MYVACLWLAMASLNLSVSLETHVVVIVVIIDNVDHLGSLMMPSE